MAVTKMNPFTPTFGRVPFALAGRNELIDDVMYGLANQPGDPNRATIFIGPRGSGKTVLLSTIAQNAAEQGWINVYAVAAEGMFGKVLRELRQKTEHLIEKTSDYDITSIQVGSIGVGREMHHDEEPIWFQVKRLVEELNLHDIPVLFTIDEIDPGCKDLIEFIAEYTLPIWRRRTSPCSWLGCRAKCRTCCSTNTYRLSVVRSSALWGRSTMPMCARRCALPSRQAARASMRTRSR